VTSTGDTTLVQIAFRCMDPDWKFVAKTAQTRAFAARMARDPDTWGRVGHHRTQRRQDARTTEHREGGHWRTFGLSVTSDLLTSPIFDPSPLARGRACLLDESSLNPSGRRAAAIPAAASVHSLSDAMVWRPRESPPKALGGSSSSMDDRAPLERTGFIAQPQTSSASRPVWGGPGS
jgi:hypothetical protein